MTKKKKKTTMKDRRRALGLSLVGFSYELRDDGFTVSPGTLKRWEDGKGQPSGPEAEQIQKTLSRLETPSQKEATL